LFAGVNNIRNDLHEACDARKVNSPLSMTPHGRTRPRGQKAEHGLSKKAAGDRRQRFDRGVGAVAPMVCRCRAVPDRVQRRINMAAVEYPVAR
jgi:hypothetical protein